MMKLTPRQLEILALIADAKSNITISELLHIETRTVEHHIHTIFRKLDLNSSKLHCRVAASNMFNHSKDRLVAEGILK